MSNILEQLDAIQSRHFPTLFEKNAVTFPYHYLILSKFPQLLFLSDTYAKEEAAETEVKGILKGIPSRLKAKLFRNF